MEMTFAMNAAVWENQRPNYAQNLDIYDNIVAP